MPVYFIQAGEDGPIKIGFASDVRKRLRNLRTAAPIPLIPLGYIEGDKKTERRLHAQFQDLRRFGEWFTPAPALMAVVSSAIPFPIRQLRPPMQAPPPLEIPESGRTVRDWLESARRTLLSEIAEFIAERRITETTFGRIAVNDGKFVERLRSGGNMTTGLMTRAHRFICEQQSKATYSSSAPEVAA
ncbi:MAG: GIY-YIG nuclease family protein [Alphaproteobacteria bacterium]